MNSVRWRRMLAPLLLSLLLFVTACASNPPSRYSQVQKETTQRGATPAVAKQAEQGSTFNKFFPKKIKGYKGYEVVPSQEKKGFAEYKVKDKDGKTVAMLSISDTTSLPTAALKYQTATEKVAGYPAVDQGTTGTGILVNGYQVKVLSRDPSFKKEDRVAWLQQFNLKELASLKPALLPSTAKAAPTIPKAPTAGKPAPAPMRPYTQPSAAKATNPAIPQRSPILTPQPAG